MIRHWKAFTVSQLRLLTQIRWYLEHQQPLLLWIMTVSVELYGCGIDITVTKLPLLIDAMVQMDEDTYAVGEGDGSVDVCVEIGSVPSGGLESELVVTLTISSGTKTGEYVYMEYENIVFLCVHALIVYTPQMKG